MATRRPKLPRPRNDDADTAAARADGPTGGPTARRADGPADRSGTAAPAAVTAGPARKASAGDGLRAAGNGAVARAARLGAALDPRRGRAERARAGGKPAAFAGAEEEDRPIPAKAFSGRLLALAVVLMTITILLAPTVRVYLSQKAEISSLQADIAAKSAQHGALADELSRWNDPNYVKAQARDRVNMVMPGDTGYWVYGDATTPAAATSAAGTKNAATAANPSSQPWGDGLWQSIKRSAAP
ncbi:MAG: septum formation initiator family protein [Actinomycetales bacterium]